MSIPIDTILSNIDQMVFTDAAKYLVANKIFDIAQKGYEKIKVILRVKWELHHYAIVPNKQEALILEELGKHPDYRTVASLIPKHRYIDIIRTGLLVKNYIEKGDEPSKIRSKEIKLMVVRRIDGITLTKIIHLTTTPYFGLVLRYLWRQKQSGYTESQLLEEFDSIITEWDADQYLPVKSNYTVTQIKRFCTKNLLAERRKFFLMGMNVAAEKIESALAQLKSIRAFSNGGYSVTTSREEDEYTHDTRIEVIVRKKQILDKILDDANLG